jgi:uncharacterized protein with PQ loop repeat
MSSITSPKSSLPPSEILFAYGLFIFGAGAVWHLVADGEFSSILTMSVMLQCLALILLGLQVILMGTASGISARTLLLDALAICCRLSSTLWLNGYLPVDASGDYIFQIVDMCSLAILLWLLHAVLVEKRNTYEAEEDNFPVLWCTFGAFLLASLLHGNMNGRPIFDTLWMANLFISTVAVLPQLWLITKTGGHVEALTSHHIAAMAAGRALSGIFMWHARGDITCDPWLGTFNHAIWAILGSHFLHMLLLGDFAFFYVKAVLARGLNCRLDVLESCGV